MKKIYSLLIAIIIGAQVAIAQCSPTLNNFEIKLSQTGYQTLKVQMRYHADAVDSAESTLPSTKQVFDGLIFAITWPATSRVELTKCVRNSEDINLVIDYTPQNKNIRTLVHDNSITMPTPFKSDWVNNIWYNVATITFGGTLANGDYFSLVNCDYGLAHPNTYNGNTTTDPWLSILEGGRSFQYSPKMITELPGTKWMKLVSKQCSNTTKKGVRCKNKTTNSNGRCSTHQ